MNTETKFQMIFVEEIPAYALSAVINDDWSSFDDRDEDDVRTMNDIKLFMDKFPSDKYTFDTFGEEYFSGWPAFGLPTNVIRCRIWRRDP